MKFKLAEVNEQISLNYSNDDVNIGLARYSVARQYDSLKKPIHRRNKLKCGNNNRK
jgi:hypothetical protein